MKWINIIRWPNLLIILMIFAVFRFGFLIPAGVSISLSDFQYFLLALSVIFITAAGYVVNDIHDRKADRINKPGKNTVGAQGGIPEKHARILYWILNSFGLALGYFMGYTVGLTILGSTHFIALLLLWMYSTDFKHRPFIGNFIVATLAALVLIIIPLYDVVPANRNYIEQYIPLFYIFGAYAFFAFFTTLIREILKDAEDLKGDRKMGSKTLAVILTQKVFKILVNVLQIALLALIIWVGIFFKDLHLLLAYLSIFLIAPILLNIYWVHKAESSKQWNHAATLIKFVMLFGIASVLVITFAG